MIRTIACLVFLAAWPGWSQQPPATQRDLKIEKIASPESAGERPNSVYAVTASAAAANRLVIEIEVRHE